MAAVAACCLLLRASSAHDLLLPPLPDCPCSLTISIHACECAAWCHRPQVLPQPGSGQMEAALPFDSAKKVLYPVSVSWQPAFTVMVDLVGHGELAAGDDVCHVLSQYGTWQPALHHKRSPTVAEALVGSLGGLGAEQRVSDHRVDAGIVSQHAAVLAIMYHVRLVYSVATPAWQCVPRHRRKHRAAAWCLQT